MQELGISKEVFEASKEALLEEEDETHPDTEHDDFLEGKSELIQIENRVQEILPEVIIPASLSKQLTKNILLDVNARALHTVKKKLQLLMAEADLVPLVVDTLAVDYAYLDYGY